MVPHRDWKEAVHFAIRRQVVPVKTTLIVAPQHMLEQWMDECRKHLKPGALRV